MKEITGKENWNNFWSLNRDSRFTRKSYSKERMMRLLGEVLRPGCEVLDAGCGSGFFSNYFIQQECNVTSLDYSDSALEITRRLTDGRSKAYLKADLLDPQFGEQYAGKFDLIFTDGLFEHFSAENQAKIMNNFKRVKRPDGIIVTFVPHRYSWWTLVRPWVMPGIHETPFTLKQLRGLHQGMEIVKSGGLNVLPIALSPEKMLGSRLGMLVYVFAR